MKSVKAKFMAIIMIVVLALTGCMNVNVDMKIESNGAGTMTTIMQISKDAYIQAMEQVGGEKLSATEKLELDAAMIAQGAKIVKIDDETYYEMTETQKLSNKEFNASLCEQEGSEGYVTGDTFYWTVNAKTASYQGMTEEDIKDMGIDMSGIKDMKEIVVIEFTKPIVSTNGNVDETNPNKVTYEIAMDATSYKMFATTKAGQTEASVKAAIKKSNTVAASKVTKLKANKVKKNAKKATVNFTVKKVNGAKYQVQYATKKNMKGAKSVTVKKTKGVIKNLKKGTKYFVRVRAIKANYAGIEKNSKWSAPKAVKTKK